MSVTAKNKDILILGIGNILLSDEGIGVHVINTLGNYKLTGDTELVDGGTAGADLLDVLSDRKKVIVVDAIEGDYQPGTIIKCSHEDLNTSCVNANTLSLHDLNLTETLAMTRLLACPPKEVIIIGIKPYSIEPGLNLTESMSQKIETIINVILSEIDSPVS